jgi:NAD(P)-dependent dehydrogenase (short-subunit alcohol dehydrogenase family)
MERVGTLTGKRVLVTGAAGGVGRAVAREMAAAGARLLLTDRVGGDFDAPASAHTHEADLTGREALETLFQEVDRVLGGLDLLVACAGVGSGPLMEMADPDWRYVIDSNLISYVGCTQRAVERMRAGGAGGTVILVGSISVHIMAVGESVYNAAKGGVASFAETLRKELMHEDIRVTLIEPGAIASPMQPFSPGDRERMAAEHRLLRPEAVADAIMFAATRPTGVDVVTLRIEPQVQKIC